VELTNIVMWNCNITKYKYYWDHKVLFDRINICQRHRGTAWLCNLSCVVLLTFECALTSLQPQRSGCERQGSGAKIAKQASLCYCTGVHLSSCYLLEVASFTHTLWCPVYSLCVYVRFSHVCEMVIDV
jgi:hypothetical protein